MGLLLQVMSGFWAMVFDPFSRNRCGYRKRRCGSTFACRALSKIRRERNEIGDCHRIIAIEIPLLPTRRRLIEMRSQLNEIGDGDLVVEVQVADMRDSDRTGRF